MTDYLESLLRHLQKNFKDQDLVGAATTLTTMLQEVIRLIKLNK